LTFEQAFKDLRGWFVNESLRRLDGMKANLEALAAGTADPDGLRSLMRGFHVLAGSGAHYGYPLVTSIGRKADRECLARVQEGGLPTDEEIGRWEQYLASLRRELTAPPQPVPTLQALASPRAAAKPEVLIAVPEPRLLDTLVGLVEGEGRSARIARTREAAVRALAERVPEALVLDIALPDGSGYEVVEHVRSLPGGAGCAILAVSDETDFLARLEALRCGADACLAVPLDQEAFLRRLRILLRHPSEAAPRVLLMQGNPSHAGKLIEVLEAAGCAIQPCWEPEAFEAQLVGFRPDLLLSDARVGGITAADLLRYLRQDDRYAALPVLVLGVEERSVVRLEAAEAGADEYLAEPFDARLVAATVATRVRRWRQSLDLMNRDGLTGAVTRHEFLGRARIAVAQKQRHPERTYAWVALDVDGFRRINDGHGHSVGDRVLVALATLLRTRLREEDTVARYADDEFGLLLTEAGADAAVRLVSRLLEEFEATEQRGDEGSPFHASFSAGVAALGAGVNVEAWRKAAEEALHAAQAGGGRRVLGQG
jgi:diguanylate cyclase (GGDEF)-like protein